MICEAFCLNEEGHHNMVKIFEVCESSCRMKYKAQKSISTHVLTSYGKSWSGIVSFLT